MNDTSQYNKQIKELIETPCENFISKNKNKKRNIFPEFPSYSIKEEVISEINTTTAVNQTLESLYDNENFAVWIRYFKYGYDCDDYNIELLSRSHTHDCYEFQILVEGSIENIINGEKRIESEGNFWFTTPEQAHSIRYHKGTDVTIFCIHFSENFTDDYFMNLIMQHSFNGILTKKDLYYILLSFVDAAKKMDLFKNFSDKEQFSKHAFLSQMLYIYSFSSGEDREEIPKVAFDNSRFTDIIVYVKKHCRERITANGVAAKFGYSLPYFCSRFKKFSGKVFTDYINDLRLENTDKLVRYTSQNINFVYRACGFTSKTFFYKLYKNKYGMTPTQARKQNSKMQ